MWSKNRIMQILRENSSVLENEFGICRIGLFGSIAKETDNSDSDVDIVIEFSRPIGLQFIEVVEFLEKILGRPVDVLTPTGVQNIRNKDIAESIANGIVYV